MSPQRSLELDAEDGSITGEYRIVLACDECGTELKDFTATVEGQVPQEFLSDHELGRESLIQCPRCRGTGMSTDSTVYPECGDCAGEGHVFVQHELSIDADEETAVEEPREIQPKTRRGRVRVATVYGVHVDATVACSCGPDARVSVDLDSERVEARDFEECCCKNPATPYLTIPNCVTSNGARRT